MIDEKTETTAVANTCLIADGSSKAAADRSDDEDAPDRCPTRADDLHARFGFASFQSARRAGQDDDPRVRVLDRLERLHVAPRERACDRPRACELLGAVALVADEAGVRRSTTVQVADELLIGVAPLPLRGEAAEPPCSDGEWETQEQQAGGEPQTAAGETPYFFPRLSPLSPSLA